MPKSLTHKMSLSAEVLSKLQNELMAEKTKNISLKHQLQSKSSSMLCIFESLFTQQQ
jgi:hypothetical protein